jgi:hypothetical protein
MEISNIINLVTAALFGGTFVIVPLLIIVHLFKIRLYKVDKQVLIQAVNTCLLLGSTIFLISLIAEIFRAYYSQTDYQQYVFLNRYTGPLWYVGAVAIISKLLLPQLFWIKKFRKSMSALICIFCMRIFLQVVPLLIMFLSSLVLFKGISTGIAYRLSYSWHDLLIYIVILTVFYFILKRKALSQPVSV